MPTWVRVAVVLLITGLLACGGGGGGSDEPPAEGESAAGATAGTEHATPPLAETAWILETLGSGDTAAAPIESTTIRIEFDAEGRVAGHSGCNRFFGGVEGGTDGAVSFGGMGSTRMACPEEIMKQETTFLDLMANVAGYRITDGKLELVSATGERLLVFRADDEA